MVNAQKVGLIHADWCGHCQTLKPHWKKFKTMIPGHTVIEIEDGQTDKNSILEKLNSELKGSSLAINGYPTIFKIVGKTVQYFQGERTADSIYKWFHESDSKYKGGKSRKRRKSRRPCRKTRKN